MRAIVAENLKVSIERYFADKPGVTNRNLFLADKAELGIGTVQRTLSCDSGASIDTLEALAKVLRLQPYKLLMPSKNMRTILSVDEQEESTEELQRRRGRSVTDIDTDTT